MQNANCSHDLASASPLSLTLGSVPRGLCGVGRRRDSPGPRAHGSGVAGWLDARLVLGVEPLWRGAPVRLCARFVGHGVLVAAMYAMRARCTRCCRRAGPWRHLAPPRCCWRCLFPGNLLHPTASTLAAAALGTGHCVLWPVWRGRGARLVHEPGGRAHPLAAIRTAGALLTLERLTSPLW